MDLKYHKYQYGNFGWLRAGILSSTAFPHIIKLYYQDEQLLIELQVLRTCTLNDIGIWNLEVFEKFLNVILISRDTLKEKQNSLLYMKYIARREPEYFPEDIIFAGNASIWINYEGTYFVPCWSSIENNWCVCANPLKG